LSCLAPLSSSCSLSVLVFLFVFLCSSCLDLGLIVPLVFVSFCLVVGNMHPVLGDILCVFILWALDRLFGSFVDRRARWFAIHTGLMSCLLSCLVLLSLSLLMSLFVLSCLVVVAVADVVVVMCVVSFCFVFSFLCGLSLVSVFVDLRARRFAMVTDFCSLHSCLSSFHSCSCNQWPIFLVVTGFNIYLFLVSMAHFFVIVTVSNTPFPPNQWQTFLLSLLVSMPASLPSRTL
jgi:hypothetical protein